MTHTLGTVPNTPGLKDAIDRAATQLFTAEGRMIVYDNGDTLFILVTDQAVDWYVARCCGGRITKWGGIFNYLHGFVEGVMRQTGYTGPVCFTD